MDNFSHFRNRDTPASFKDLDFQRSDDCAGDRKQKSRLCATAPVSPASCKVNRGSSVSDSPRDEEIDVPAVSSAVSTSSSKTFPQSTVNTRESEHLRPIPDSAQSELLVTSNITHGKNEAVAIQITLTDCDSVPVPNRSSHKFIGMHDTESNIWADGSFEEDFDSFRTRPDFHEDSMRQSDSYDDAHITNIATPGLSPDSSSNTFTKESDTEAKRSLTPLNDLIKRALSEKRHMHHLKVPQSDDEDNSRLYQSDSYLPALRLQLDTQSSSASSFTGHSTLPRAARKHSVRFPSPPQIIVGESDHYAESNQSSCSYQGSSNHSLDDHELSEEKTSPPISPLSKGLHCSSLSLYLPPPSISSLNKMWHRYYSGDSITGNEEDKYGGNKKGLDSTVHYDLAAKVILLGDYSVGKTSFLSTLSRAKDENGSGFCKEYRPGELAEVVFKRQQKRAMIRVMDTGGQERYRSMTSSYYRGVHGCLLVFDVTREETFNNIMIWHSDLLKYSTDQYVAAILVGTTSHPRERVISPERGLKMAESLGMPYMECSPEDSTMTLAIVQRLTESVIKFALRRSSFAIDIKPQSIVLEETKKKKFVCLC
ncbi:ras-related protein rab-3 [Plakobranchus ocellatus]|uniref:Ras-related protein rab-3 n=1 Tax=Plakobranchus ocellatus TaxID=259542 RepID=A0AAV4B2G0_9GAST|nr:ras-related protein rab-3 [Plakobranchus ocellatus]